MLLTTIPLLVLGGCRNPWMEKIVGKFFEEEEKFNVDPADMVLVRAGSFQMGKYLGTGSYTDETNTHTVTLTEDFYMYKYPVTQEMYQAVMGTNPSYFTTANGRPPNTGETDGRRPVEQVSWYDALVFCNRLSMMEGLTPAYQMQKDDLSGTSTNPADWGAVPSSSGDARWDAVTMVAGSTGYRLPTEAQWEYAAKGGHIAQQYDFAGSDNVDNVAWYGSNSNSKTHEVMKKAANALGLFDMSGNVFEWCWDWYGTYSSGAQTDPTGASSGSFRVVRGGYWGSAAVLCRSADRHYYYPDSRNYGIGFRLVRPSVF
ncbi:MAG: formylglycine-generating enzyme family protein [Treponema sp.]|nr:formylglycine-generating enzyme family protein [Treponema sp.]